MPATTTARTDGFRRVVGAACLLVSPLLFAAAELLAPEVDGTRPVDQLAAYTNHYRPALGAVGLALLMTMTLLVATFAVLGAVRARGAALAHAAAAMVVYGLVTAHAALPGANLVMAEMARPGNDRGAMVMLMDGIFHDPMGLPLLLGHYVFTLGIVLLGVTLLRAGLGPRWAGVCVLLAPVCDMVLGGLVGELSATLVSDVLWAAGFAAVAWHLLTVRERQDLLAGGEPEHARAAVG